MVLLKKTCRKPKKIERDYLKMCRKKYVILAKTYDKRGRLLAVGLNDYNRSHPYMAYLSAKVGLPEKQYLHAEVLACLRSKEKKIHKLTVERYNADGSLALAKPCVVCQECIKAYGVKIIEYTSSEGWVKEIL